jgi:hypothetical protein
MSKCRLFSDIQVWPISSIVNPEGWLGNFDPGDQDHAVHLLNSFMYFSEVLTDEIFKGAFASMGALTRTRGIPVQAARAEWRRLSGTFLVTYVTGERPNPTDSGHLFARKARQVLGLDQDQVVEPAEALRMLSAGTRRPVVFVDDFSGSGDQFVETWQRMINLRGVVTSFAQAAAAGVGEYHYVCAVATGRAASRFARECPRVQLHAGHVLGPRYSALTRSSVLWPADLQTSGPEFIRRITRKRGLTRGISVPWNGYQGLGLALAFAHSVPDATLPIFYSEANGWTPLIKRR